MTTNDVKNSRAPLGSIAALLFCLATTDSSARSYDVNGDLIGELEIASTQRADTLSDLARAYDQGYLEMRHANPGVDPWLPGEETEIIIPSLYVLPDAPREDIVVNVPEMRLYYYPKVRSGAHRGVTTHPVSIGRQQWTTPHGVTSIVQKIKDPAWYPPESIREEHAAEGNPLPKVVPAGPDNPLGAYKMRLGLPGYLIHGTNRPYGIGMRVTHGCMRMYPKDVEQMFESVAVGTQVRIVNQPYKIGVAHEKVYLEVHPHLAEDEDKFRDQFSHVVELIAARTEGLEVQLNWRQLQTAIETKSGIPSVVGTVRAVPVDVPTARVSLSASGTPRAN